MAEPSPEAGLPALARMIEDPVLLVDAEGTVLDANSAALSAHGPELVGAPLASWADPATTASSIRQLLRSTSPMPVRLMLRAHGQEPAPVQVTGARSGTEATVMLRIPAGEHDAFAALTASLERTNAEIARRREVEARLQQLLSTTVADLEAANASLRSFAGAVAHDLKNPLVAIRGFGQLIERQPDLPEGVLRLTDALRSSTDGAFEMISTMLEEAETASGGGLVPVDPGAVLSGVPPLIGPDLDDGQLRCGSLPLVMARPGALQQIFLNLIANAIRHGADRPVVIDVSARPDYDDMTVIVLADDGRGIPPEQREAVFERGAMSASTGGTGLGLFNSRAIVEQMGGDLWFEDSPLGGVAACVALSTAPSP